MLINSRDALVSGATLHRKIEETFDEFIDSYKSKFELNDIENFVKTTKN